MTGYHIYRGYFGGMVYAESELEYYKEQLETAEKTLEYLKNSNETEAID